MHKDALSAREDQKYHARHLLLGNSRKNGRSESPADALKIFVAIRYLLPMNPNIRR